MPKIAAPTLAEHHAQRRAAILAAATGLLQREGAPAVTPAAVVERACDPAMRVVRGTVGTIAALAAAEGIVPPAITIIGDVAALDFS